MLALRPINELAAMFLIGCFNVIIGLVTYKIKHVIPLYRSNCGVIDEFAVGAADIRL